jgi:hypothetical protein
MLQEILSLLEGIDLHKEDWVKVAEHVNNVSHGGEAVRTHEECITAFIRFGQWMSIQLYIYIYTYII